MTDKTGLELLREPFSDNQISQLPKGTKKQNECNADEKRNCAICGGWHHPKTIHLSYVGHAALTDRLLDADPRWEWEPLALTDVGLPAFDDTGGLWIKLSVCGCTRIGYGNAEKSAWKSVGDREKEVIGDALRNAAMRFGAALDLWHKGDLHKGEKTIPEKPPEITEKEAKLLLERAIAHGIDKDDLQGFMKWEGNRTFVSNKDLKMATDLLKEGVFESAVDEYMAEVLAKEKGA